MHVIRAGPEVPHSAASRLQPHHLKDETPSHDGGVCGSPLLLMLLVPHQASEPSRTAGDLLLHAVAEELQIASSWIGKDLVWRRVGAKDADPVGRGKGSESRIDRAGR